MLLRRDFNHARASACREEDRHRQCMPNCRLPMPMPLLRRRSEENNTPGSDNESHSTPRASERASESPLSRSCRERRQFIHIELRSHYIGGSSIDRSTGRVHTALHCARDCRQEEDEDEYLKFNAYCKPCVHPRAGRGVLGEVVERRGAAGGGGARTCIIKRRRWAGRARGPTNLMYGLWTD